MFRYNLFSPFPWERGIAPDAVYEGVEAYYESSLTEGLRTSRRTRRKIKSLEGVYVALLRFIGGAFKWAILDGSLVVVADSEFQGILYKIEFLNLIVCKKRKCPWREDSKERK